MHREPGSFVRGNGCCWKPVVLFSNTPCSLLEEFLFVLFDSKYDCTMKTKGFKSDLITNERKTFG
jgi:hypothetical protein